MGYERRQESGGVGGRGQVKGALIDDAEEHDFIPETRGTTCVPLRDPDRFCFRKHHSGNKKGNRWVVLRGTSYEAVPTMIWSLYNGKFLAGAQMPTWDSPPCHFLWRLNPLPLVESGQGAKNSLYCLGGRV